MYDFTMIKPLYAVCFTLIAVNVLVAAPKLPEGDPPQPGKVRLDVTDPRFAGGADPADSGHNDSAAIAAAVRAATPGTTIYFPAGVYNIHRTVRINGAAGLSLQGDGALRSQLKREGPFWKPGDAQTYEKLREAYQTDAKILLFEDCADLCIADLGFDANGTPTFGGVGIKRVKRLSITRTRYIDSREQAPLFGKDRFAWIITGYHEGCEDVWFTDNLVEGLQVEIDSVRRALIERNILRRSVKSPGIGFLSANFGNQRFADGFANTDITVRRNYLSNGAVMSMGMITFQLDPAHNCNSVFRDIDIVDNVLVYDLAAEQPPSAIKLGTGDSSLKTRGNVFERFRIENNRIYRAPGIAMDERYPAYIWFNAYAGEARLNHTVIRGNRLYADTEARPVVKIAQQKQSRQLTVESNTVQPYQLPPAPHTVVGQAYEP